MTINVQLGRDGPTVEYGDLSKGEPWTRVRREALYERQEAARWELWEQQDAPWGYCHICDEYGPILTSSRIQGDGVCVEGDACNLRMCERTGHFWGPEQRRCISQDELGWAGAMANIGHNKWLLYRRCLRCGEAEHLERYQEDVLRCPRCRCWTLPPGGRCGCETEEEA